jgi:DNA-binding beta-propeller fold protein YncE
MKPLLVVLLMLLAGESLQSAEAKRLLYVATPGIRNYLEYGGHGLLVYDMDDGHRFLKRIPTAGLDEMGKPRNVKGICASASLKRVFITTPKTMMAVDLISEKVLWEKQYEGGCDRMAISPDGKTIYVPSFESDHWNVVDGSSGNVIRKIVTKSGAHNTVFGPNGKQVYLAGLKSPYLFVAKTSEHDIETKIGPFSAAIRPFTVNFAQTLCFVNVNELLGFEVGDLRTGEKLHRVEVKGFSKGPVKRHGCPSHGAGLTVDEKELWLTDAANSRLHIFDNTKMPPLQVASIELRDQPGWVTFSVDGQFAYPSTGEVIDPKTRKILTILKDENGQPIQSEKMVEIDFEGGQPVRVGDQFGIGRKAKTNSLL